MLSTFFKYQSLGNDFVLFDWFEETKVQIDMILNGKEWSSYVAKTCDRHFGVGADGVLILRKSIEDEKPELLIFNSDGSRAEMCLNGTRCVSAHLVNFHSYPDQFNLKIGMRTVKCNVAAKISKTSSEIITNAGSATIEGPVTVNTTNEGVYEGFKVNVGNPHFVTLNKTSLGWLKQHGQLIESDVAFPKKTNVEFVWLESISCEIKTYMILVYERGCGVTLACGSGAVAVMTVLKDLGEIKVGERVVLQMLGGSILSWLDADGSVNQKASASLVFEGSFCFSN